MANVDSAFGFRPINMDGSPYNGATRRCVFAAADATAAFIGDPVTLDGSSDTGYAGVSQAATGEAIFGVVTAFEANPDGLSDQYRKASTKRFCQVAVADQNKYFEIQSDDETTALSEAMVGLNADFVVGSGDTAYGISAVELNSDTATTVSTTMDLQIVGLVDRVDNQLSGTGSTNKNVIVTFNDPQNKAFRTGV
jgi:hypothetical protein